MHAGDPGWTDHIVGLEAHTHQQGEQGRAHPGISARMAEGIESFFGIDLDPELAPSSATVPAES